MSEADGALSPMMAQYIEIKAANPDCLLFYRMGDFYELFFDDAEIASRALGIVLTKRGRHEGRDIPMCGVPVVRSDDYLQRLIGQGHRVAVCEQLEDPAEARKRGSRSVVRRDVVRLVTPGTVTEEALLDPAAASILLAVARVRTGESDHAYGLAEIDITTGRFVVGEADDQTLAAEIARIDPREIVVADVIRDDPALAALWRETRAAVVPVARDGFDEASAGRRIRDWFGVGTLDGFGHFGRHERAAAAQALAYVERTQLGARPALTPPSKAGSGAVMQIDAATRANLELLRTLAGERRGSLLAAIDRTVTPAGGRLLAERLAGPLTDPGAIGHRLDTVDFFRAAAALRVRVRQALAAAPDMPRALARLALGRGGPRDLAAIGDGVAGVAAVAALLSGDGPQTLPPDTPLPPGVAEACRALCGVDPDLGGAMRAALGEDLPLHRRDGGFVREGHEPSLDEARALRDESRRVIMALQARYAETAGARTLRVKHNNFLGYFVEVPAETGQRFLTPPLNAVFIHRQTMQGSMRFSTAELGELESRIASAGDRAQAIEEAVFDRLTAAVLAVAEPIKRAAQALAEIDVAAASADLAEARGWVRPLVDGGLDFRVRGGRHPVVEAAVGEAGQSFVANDCDLSPAEGGADGRILLVTGPNMAGKSTFLRQNALIAVLAQMGSHVPADLAHVGVVDRLFSRVGAADDLARGRSTFMVEMVETAAILNQAGPRALVILDEIGRGTATFDGLSIAWAAIEHLHDVNRSRALFATHFHELTSLASVLSRVENVTVRVADHRGEVVFLHEVVPGAADRSYGVQVAKLAGLPRAVVDRARVILEELEKGERQSPVHRLLDDLPLFAHVPKPAAVAPEPDGLRAAVAALAPDEMTPRQALDALYDLRRLIG